MPTVTVTDPIELLPIEPSPLPYQWRFKVKFNSTKIMKNTIGLWVSHEPVGSAVSFDLQGTLNPSGYSEALLFFLRRARNYNLWGQTIQVRANYAQPSGSVAWATESAPQDLVLPVAPLLVYPVNTAHGLTLPPFVPLPSPESRRVFWSNLPPYLTSNGWMIDSENRLASVTLPLGFNRFDYWLSALKTPIKFTKNIQNGEDFVAAVGLSRILRSLPGKTQGTVSELMTAFADAAATKNVVIWNSTRLVIVRKGFSSSCAEYDSSGYHQFSLDDWAAGQPSSAIWNVRQIYQFHTANGLASVL